MTSEPYASIRTVFWIVDNGNSHAGKASIQRLKEPALRRALPTDRQTVSSGRSRAPTSTASSAESKRTNPELN